MSGKIKNEMILIEHDEKNNSQSKYVSNGVEKALLMKEICEPIINAVEFCSNILSRNGLGISLNIDRFKSYRDIALSEFKYLFNSENDLMKLFCTFPLLFHVVGNKVMLRNWIIFHLNQQEWLKELVPNSFHLVPIYVSTIQFYCNELFQITPWFELPIRQLFSHKSKAPEAIQAVTKNIKEFILFLKMYPEIFHLKGDKVMLSKSAVSYRSVESWVRRLMVGDFTLVKQVNEEETITGSRHSGIKFYELLKNEVVVYEAVGFHYKIILTNGSVKGMSLPKLFSRNNRVMPSTSFIKNIMDFEIFITSYPEVFSLINKTVFLTQLYPSISHTECTSETDHLNCSRIKEDGLNLKNNDQTVISFYLRILNNISNMPGKITEFPINHLVYYNVIAPPEVRKIAKNVNELKNFLSQFPQYFKINSSDNIVFDETGAFLEPNEKLEEVISFYTNKLHELGGTAKIEQLLGYGRTSKDNQSITTTFEDLKKFFSSQQNFFVVDNCVSLRNKHKEIDFEMKTKNAINFYSNVLKKYRTQVVSLIKISGHRGSAPADVQTVAKNPKELKSFFSQFPEIFTIVEDNKVMFSKPCEKIITMQHQQKIFSSEMICDNSEQKAVEFFSKMLNHYGICRILSINKLFELKLKSSPAIQKISGSNINQFLAFLRKYPQEFLLTNDNVIARKKIPKWSYSGKYEDKKFTDPLLLLVFNFLKKYTSNKSLFHIDYLYNNVGRFFLYNDETPVFPTKSDLLLFLGLYPHIFFVDYHRIVNVIACSRKAFVSASEKKQSKIKNTNKQNISSNIKSEKLMPIVTDLKLPQDHILTPLVTDTKQSSIQVEEDVSIKSETKEKASKKKNTPKQPKKGLGLRTRNRKKTKTSTLPPVERSFSEESLVSEMSKNFDEGREAEFNSLNGLKLENNFRDNQFTPYWGNDNEGEFIPSQIEEIENNIFSNLIGQLNNKKHLPKNNEDLLSNADLILNDSFRHTVSSTFQNDFSRKENFHDLVTEALIFLNHKLWEEGNLKIIKIEELFNSFSQSVLNVSNCYFQSVEDFEIFLCQFPDHFIISQNKVMARKNKIQKYLLNKAEESLPIVLFHFFNLYTKHFNYILLKLLYSQVGKYFCNINRSPFFKTLGDLVLFLEMFPKVFVIDNNQIVNITASNEKVYQSIRKFKFNSGVIKIDTFLDKKLYSTVVNEKYPTIPESTEGWKDYVLERTQIIEDLSLCRVVTADILNTQKVIALDCEGVNLGAAGRLTLIQIALKNGQVYIFDIIKETSMVNDGGLKDVLESELILKVIHDSRNDVANLYTEYGVKITPIFDTRVVHHLIVNQGVSPRRISSKLTAIGFNELCSKYGANLNVQKDEMKDVYKSNPSYWMSRPLTKDMIAYAALDVASLVPQIFFTMLKQLKGVPERLLWELSVKHSLSVLNNKDLLFD